VARVADVDRRREAEDRDDVPGTGERCLPSLVGSRGREAVERGDSRIEQLQVRGLAAEAKRQLGDHRRAREARQIEPQLGPRALDIEPA